MAILNFITNSNLLNKSIFNYNLLLGNTTYIDNLKELTSIGIDNNYNLNYYQKEYLKFLVSLFN